MNCTHIDADQQVVKVDSLKQGPKLIVNLDDTLFEIDSSWHVRL